ncbi:MAG: glycosyltransferase family 39 protein, partial [Verrucomicrobiae bacterium]|nr:glycosyltransferase family 39 protein [Verrucomicrobiae bacterium]
EAYQWVWSKHLALSYFSKPPMIAYLQFIGTTLWGDSEFGIRFFSPVITALISLLVLRFFAREVNARAGFFLVLMITTAPMISVGSVLMTIDPPLVLFWTAAMLAGWKAVQPHGRTRDWAWVGIWSALGFLSKYSSLFQWVSFFLFLVAWRPARRHLFRPGPYLGLLINALALVPVWIWNAQHEWITLTHLHDRAGLNQEWHFTLRYLGDFTGAVVGLLNPVFAVGLVWAGIQSFRKRRHDARLMYLLAMGAPLMIGYWLYAFRARVHPNWIAPAVLPLFAVLVIYAETRWRESGKALRRWLIAGLVVGGLLVAFLHETNWVAELAGRPLPAKLDPLRRVRYWSELAETVDQQRRELELAEGKPTFVIAAHYGLTGQISFYLPDGRARVKDDPLVFYQSAEHPENQFWFWPGYKDRQGQNAIYVIETDEERPPLPRIVEEFESVTSLGLHDTLDRGRVMRRVQLFACRGLR